MKAKVLIIGEYGFLSSHLRSSACLNNKFIVDGTSRVGYPKLNLAEPDTFNEFEEYIAQNKPKYIIIPAAVPDVELCAKDPVGTRKVNVHGTQSVLEIALKYSVVPVFFSSDYALSPVRNLHLMKEDDECNPQTEYGRQKREVEVWISEKFDRYVIFRTSKLISMYNHPKNILSQIAQDLKEKKKVLAFQDQWITPVFLEDIARILSHEKFDSLSGIYHLASKTPITRFELANKVKITMGLGDEFEIEALSLLALQSLEVRPRFNTLNSEKICSLLDFQFTEISEHLDKIKT